MTEELIFRTKVETGNSAKEIETVREALEEAKKAGDQLKKTNTDVSKTFEEVYGDLQPLNTRLGEAEDRMYELALAGKKTSQEFLDLQAEVVRYKQTLMSVDAEVDSLAQRGGNLKAALELGSTVMAGYGAYQGVAALTGMENEALAETFVKLQAVESVLAGIEQARAALEKESLLVTKAKVIWTKTATAAQYIYTTAVGTTTGAMKALRIAMLAIPIIALVAGIVALVSAISSLISEEEVAEEQNNKLNASFERQNEALEANSRAFKRNADNKRALMVSENATAEELFNFDKKRLADEEVLRRKNMLAIHKMVIQKKMVYIQALQEENYELAKTIKDEQKQIKEKYRALKELDGQYQVDLKLLENKRKNDLAKEEETAEKEREQKAKEAHKRALERRREENLRRLEEERLYQDLLVQNIVDSDARRIAQMKLQHSRELAETKKKYGENSRTIQEMEKRQSTELSNLLSEIAKEKEEKDKEQREKEIALEKSQWESLRKSRKAEIEGRIIELREDFEAQMEVKRELAQFEMIEAISQENVTEGEKFKIRQEYLQKLEELNKEQAEKEKERQKQIVEAGKQVFEMGLSASQNLADAFFDYKIAKAQKGSAEELKLEKRKFEINKKLQIAQAIMQGIQATLAAYSSGVSIPVVGPIAGPAFAAIAATTSALNIAKIKNTQFEGGASGSTGSASVPTVSVPSVKGQDTEEDVTTKTAGLKGSGSENKETLQVVILGSELQTFNKESKEVSIVSNVG